jgi:hypothetical protein
MLPRTVKTLQALLVCINSLCFPLEVNDESNEKESKRQTTPAAAVLGANRPSRLAATWGPILAIIERSSSIRGPERRTSGKRRAHH